MQSALFVLDILGDTIFEGYTLPEYWYGFVCPYFTYDQAERVAEIWRNRGLQAWYNAELDQFTFEMIIESRKNSWDFAAVEIEEIKLYPIGAHFWFWQEYGGPTQED